MEATSHPLILASASKVRSRMLSNAGVNFEIVVSNVDEDAIKITGTPKVFTHTADSGAVMEKHFCPDCGSQLFGRNSDRPNALSLRAGVLDQTSLVTPSINVYMESKIASTPIDPDLTGFPKMPG